MQLKLKLRRFFDRDKNNKFRYIKTKFVLFISIVFIYAALLFTTNALGFTHSINIPLLNERPPLSYALNGFFLHYFGRFSVFCLHSVYAISVFVIGVYIISTIRPKSRLSLILFTIFLLGHILWHEEVYHVRDTLPFGLITILFVAVVINTQKRFYWQASLVGITAGLGWLTRANGIVFIPLLLLWPWLIKNNTWFAKLKYAIFSLLIYFIIISPWQWIIFNKNGHFSPSPYPGNGSYNIVKGNSELTFDIYPYIDIDLIDELIRNHNNKTEQSHTLTGTKFTFKSSPDFVVFKTQQIILFFLPIQVPFGSGNVSSTDDQLEIYNFKLHHIYRFPFVVSLLIPMASFPCYLLYIFDWKAEYFNHNEFIFKSLLRADPS